MLRSCSVRAGMCRQRHDEVILPPDVAGDGRWHSRAFGERYIAGYLGTQTLLTPQQAP